MAKKNKILSQPELNDYVHWAIISQLKSHRLAFHINEVNHWNLKRLKNLSITSTHSGFALYHYHHNDLHPEFYLLSLKDENRVLVKELKNFDYLIQIRLNERNSEWNEEELFSQLKEISEVLDVLRIDIDNIKNSNSLFFDKHLDDLEFEPETTQRKARTKIELK